MRLPREAPGARKGAGHGGGRTRSTGAGCAGSTRRTRADEDLAVGFDDELAPLVVRSTAQHADAALVLGLVELLGHGPFGGKRIARPHGFLEAAGVLEIGDRGSREIHADRRRDERAGEGAVQDAPAEERLTGEFLVDVQRIEVAEQARAEDEVRLRHGDAGAEAIADVHLVVALAREHGRKKGAVRWTAPLSLKSLSS